MFRHGSVFSGGGGLDLAAQWMGWENLFWCEKEPFLQKLLRYYWPNAQEHGNIKTTDFNIYRGRIDVLTGGFPCQPYSTAGKRLGKKDDRHLWPEMLRAIRQIQPTWVVGENVYGIVNWNDGLVFQEVQTDLENEGYEVQSYILPAAGVGAPHQRYRVFFVANSIHNRTLRGSDKYEGASINERLQEWNKVQYTTFPTGLRRHYSNTNSLGLGREINREGIPGFFNQKSSQHNWENFPTESPICHGDDGVSPRLDGITFSKWRRESIKAGGNAVVPQIALQIFRSIEMYEHLMKN